MSEQFFAQINENNIVTDVHVVTEEFMKANPERYPGVWVETFFNVENKIYAGIGFTYNEQTKDFTPPPPPLEPVEK